MDALRIPMMNRGYERLLTEDQAIKALALQDRPNPKGSLRWLMRTGKLPCVKLGRGIYAFRSGDIDALVRSSLVSCAGQTKN